MNEKSIEEFLRENKPAVSDDPTFILETRRRMAEVEGIKGEVDRQRRHGRLVLIVTLVTGLVVGALLSALVMLHPTLPDVFDSAALAHVVAVLQPWRYFLLLPVAGCAIALGLTLKIR